MFGSSTNARKMIIESTVLTQYIFGGVRGMPCEKLVCDFLLVRVGDQVALGSGDFYKF